MIFISPCSLLCHILCHCNSLSKITLEQLIGHLMTCKVYSHMLKNLNSIQRQKDVSWPSPFFFFLNTLNWKCTKIVITCCVHRSNTQILETCRAKSYGMWAQGACSGISLLSAAQMRASTRLSTSGPMCGPLSLCHLAATLILVITVRAQVLSILCTDIVPRKQSPRWVWMVNPC